MQLPAFPNCPAAVFKPSQYIKLPLYTLDIRSYNLMVLNASHKLPMYIINVSYNTYIKYIASHSLISNNLSATSFYLHTILPKFYPILPTHHTLSKSPYSTQFYPLYNSLQPPNPPPKTSPRSRPQGGDSRATARAYNSLTSFFTIPPYPLLSVRIFYSISSANSQICQSCRATPLPTSYLPHSLSCQLPTRRYTSADTPLPVS